MTCHNCNTLCKKSGKHRNGLQQFLCKQCRKTFTEDHADPLDWMYTPVERAAQVLQLLLEGCSVSSTERITGIHHTTILSLLSLAGQKCQQLMDSRVRNVRVSDVQCDEIWGFVFKKEQNKWPLEAKRRDIGDAYTFVAIERDLKLVLAFHLGRRDKPSTMPSLGSCEPLRQTSGFRSARTDSAPISTRLTMP